VKPNLELIQCNHARFAGHVLLQGLLLCNCKKAFTAILNPGQNWGLVTKWSRFGHEG
jgi:hypothetical protein